MTSHGFHLFLLLLLFFFLLLLLFFSSSSHLHITNIGVLLANFPGCCWGGHVEGCRRESSPLGCECSLVLRFTLCCDKFNPSVLWCLAVAPGGPRHTHTHTHSLHVGVLMSICLFVCVCLCVLFVYVSVFFYRSHHMRTAVKVTSQTLHIETSDVLCKAQ